MSAEPRAGPAAKLLDWHDSAHWNWDGDKPCRYCGWPTPLLDSKRSPAHKVCAEEAFAIQAADAAAAYRRDTL